MRRLIFLLILLLPLKIHSQSRGLDDVDDKINLSPGSSWLQSSKSQITVEYQLYLNDFDTECGNVSSFYASEWIMAFNKAADPTKFSSYIAGVSPAQWYISDSVLEPTKWYHVAMTYDGAFRRHYVNGVLDGTPLATTGSTSGQGANTNIQIAITTFGRAFNGQIDELKIYSYAKTNFDTDKVTADEEEGLELYWGFDEETGMPFDKSGNGNHATAITGTFTADNAPIKRIIGE